MSIRSLRKVVDDLQNRDDNDGNEVNKHHYDDKRA